MFRKSINITLSTIVLLIVLIATIVLGYFYFFENQSTKLEAILGGSLVATIFMLIQLILTWKDFNNNELLSRFGLRNILSKRDDKAYYSNLIKSTKKEFNLFFHTGNRFCEDFCGTGGDDDLLINQLRKNKRLKVQLLVQDKDLLSASDQNKFELADEAFSRMKSEFPDRFEVKYYRFTPCHNIFATENDVIVGPYFEHIKGKYTHSVHFKRNASYVDEYMEYFKDEWQKANNNATT